MTFPFGGPIYDSTASLPAATQDLYDLQVVSFLGGRARHIVRRGDPGAYTYAWEDITLPTLAGESDGNVLRVAQQGGVNSAEFHMPAVTALAFAQARSNNSRERAALDARITALENAGGHPLAPISAKMLDFFRDGMYQIHAAADHVRENSRIFGVYDKIAQGSDVNPYLRDATTADGAGTSTFSDITFTQVGFPGTNEIGDAHIDVHTHLFDWSSMDDSVQYRIALNIPDTFVPPGPRYVTMTGAQWKALDTVPLDRPTDGNRVLEVTTVVAGGGPPLFTRAKYVLFRSGVGHIALGIVRVEGTFDRWTSPDAHVTVSETDDSLIRITGSAFVTWPALIAVETDGTAQTLIEDYQQHFPLVRTIVDPDDATKLNVQVNNFTRKIPATPQTDVRREIDLQVAVPSRGYTYAMTTTPLPTDLTSIADHELIYDYVVQDTNGRDYFYRSRVYTLPDRLRWATIPSASFRALGNAVDGWQAILPANTYVLPQDWWNRAATTADRSLRAIRIQSTGRIRMQFTDPVIGGSDPVLIDGVFNNVEITLSNPTAGDITVVGLGHSLPGLSGTYRYSWVPDESGWANWIAHWVNAGDKSITFSWRYVRVPFGTAQRNTIIAPDGSAYIEFATLTHDETARTYTLTIGIGRPATHLETRLLVRNAQEIQVYDSVSAEIARRDDWVDVLSEDDNTKIQIEGTRHVVAFEFHDFERRLVIEPVIRTLAPESSDPSDDVYDCARIDATWSGVTPDDLVFSEDRNAMLIAMVAPYGDNIIAGFLLNHYAEQWAFGLEPHITQGSRELPTAFVMPMLKGAQSDEQTIEQRTKNMEVVVQDLMFNAAGTDWDMFDGRVANLVPTANFILNEPQNGQDGQTYILRVAQDNAGSRTITLHADIETGDLAAPVLSTAANALDYLHFTYNADAFHYTGIDKGY